MKKNKRQRVAIVIPIYEAQPHQDEISVLKYFLKLFHKYPIVFMKKEGLDVGVYQTAIDEVKHPSIIFEEFSWNGYLGYNRLMVEKTFYKRFLHYEYILIAHLDAFAFSDDLEDWCNKGYDYVGSVIHNIPFVEDYIKTSRLLRWLQKKNYLKVSDFQNGGFSLRKVTAFYRSCSFYGPLIKRSNLVYSEDFFWSVRLPQMNPFFRVAPESTARSFSIELPKENDENFVSVRDSVQSLPFGCHGWKKHGYSFWKPILEKNMQTKLSD
ncbi:DUF5672 family protein [Cytophagaceae bacterium DM2B3-1]|uniref:DUF5672 family protein n=1 Tax=Xanthocytophaga flava TaxID=3048013 RepID=A0ABT7CLM9_9BACT|nr:DUF5672 family protein [Xanthocytophaga flavus]MDJ1494654.1 DUF5672 family protein [Xanthocytophaga flavus]